MDTESVRHTFSEVADRLSTRSLPVAIGEVALTALSFCAPPKERLYRIIRSEYRTCDTEANDLQPPLEDVVSECAQVIAGRDLAPTSHLSTVQMTRLVGTMFQFSDRTPFIESAMKTPYVELEEIYDQTVETAKESGPVNFAQSLQFALARTNHLPSAQWNLFLASRQFARWRDSDVIDGMPPFTTEQKMNRMKLWGQSIAACKSPDEYGYQDTAGDAYYVWTHALARTIYDALPNRESWLGEFYKTAFTNGSRVMGLSRKLGVISVLGTMSDHIPASQYGNAIGQLCADTVKDVNASYLADTKA